MDDDLLEMVGIALNVAGARMRGEISDFNDVQNEIERMCEKTGLSRDRIPAIFRLVDSALGFGDAI